MASLNEHIKKHSRAVAHHIRRHHKKYIFGIVGGAITVKLVLTFVASIGIYESANTFAQEIPGEEIRQENLPENFNTFEEGTGEVQTGSENTGVNLTGEVQTGSENTGVNLTGEVQTGSENTGENLTGEVQTGSENTGENLTGEVQTGSENTGENLTGEVQTGNNQTGGFTQTPQNENIICNNSDFHFINPLSGSKLKGNINFSRTYSGNDCSGKNFDIYLRDHNNQRIKIGTSSYLNTRFQFDSSKLYSGFYNILSGSSIIYSGQYSGLNSRFYTGYYIRLIDQNSNIVYTGDLFTIDNQVPEITGIIIEYTGNYNILYIGLSGIINLSFTSSEELTGINISILGTNANFINKSGLNYKYSITLSSQNSGSNFYSNISFIDLAGNTGSKYLTSSIIFDKTIPSLSYISFTGTYTGFDVIRSGSEITKYEFTYILSGSQTGIVLYTTSYNYTGILNITGLDQTKTYNFALKLMDPVNNTMAIGGKISFNTGGKVGFTYQTISVSNNSGTNTVVNVSTGSTGSIVTMSEILKKEVNKFNECRDDIKITKINIKIDGKKINLNMPDFEKSYIRKIVNAFTIIIMDKLEKSDLDKEGLDDIINRFDDFLVILKLVRDDENQCKQNLSNYHIRLFQKTLNEYNISLE